MGFSARKLSAFDIRNQIICNNIAINTSSFSLNTSGNAIALNKTIEIPGEPTLYFIQVFSLNGGVWTQVGSDILRPQDPGSALESTWGENIKINSNGNVIAFNYIQEIQSYPRLVQGKTRVLSWNGSDWIQLGSDIVFPLSSVSSSFQMAANSNCDSLFICYSYSTSPTSSRINKNSVFSWNGSSWNQLGSDISNTSVDGISMNSIGNRIAVNVENSSIEYGNLSVFSFNGSSWVQTGTTITGSFNVDYDGSIALNSSGNILAAGYITESTEQSVRFFSFDGSNWIQIREDLSISSNVEISSNWRSEISLISNGDAIAYYERNAFSNYDKSAIYVYYWNNDYWNNDRWVQLFGISDNTSDLGIPLQVPTPNSLDNYVSYIKNSKIIALRLLNK